MIGSQMAIYRRATMVFRSHDVTRVFDWYINTTSNEESDEDSDEVMSDGKEVTNMLDDSHDSDTD